MKEVTVRELWIYPVKSFRGDSVEELQITEEGIVGDREFALVRENGTLADQKLSPKMALISARMPSVDGPGLLLKAGTDIYSHAIRKEGPPLPATWVLDEFEGVDQGDDIAQWVSNIIDEKVRMIRIDKSWTVNFPVPDLELVHGKPKRRFTAATEVSLANLASLDKLNEDLEKKISIHRFRTNVIVDGIEAYEEDNVVYVGNEDVQFQQVTPAERCVIITTDHNTGERAPNNIMKVLSKTRKKPAERKFGSGLEFGNYMTVSKPGHIYVGDRLKLTAKA